LDSGTSKERSIEHQTQKQGEQEEAGCDEHAAVGGSSAADSSFGQEV
jgi:hypothetical protein